MNMCCVCEACPIADSCVSVQVKGPKLAPGHMIQGFQAWTSPGNPNQMWQRQMNVSVSVCFTHSTNTPLSSTCSQTSTSPSRPERNSGKCGPGRLWNAEGRVRHLPPPPGPRYTHDSCAPTACLPLQHTSSRVNTLRYSVRQTHPRRSAPVPLNPSKRTQPQNREFLRAGTSAVLQWENAVSSYSHTHIHTHTHSCTHTLSLCVWAERTMVCELQPAETCTLHTHTEIQPPPQ